MVLARRGGLPTELNPYYKFENNTSNFLNSILKKPPNKLERLNKTRKYKSRHSAISGTP